MSTLWTLSEISPDYWYNDTSDITENGAVSQWNDLSGNDYHVSQATGSLQPTTGTQNGLRVLTFDDDRLDFPSGAMGVYRDVPYAWCLVVRRTDNPSVTAHSVFWQHGTGTGARFNISSVNDAPRAGGRRLDADGFESVVSGTARTDWVMQLAILDYDNRSLHLWVDGEEVDSQTSAWSGSGNSSDTDSLAASIGDAPQGTAGPFEGDMGEVAGGGFALSQDDIDKIFGYAAHRWGLEDNLDSDHPYKDEAPTLPAVENVQATSLGSDSIQVTWDQFENDESPPVAADGYEIEIDEGTPIDVGDVQTYTDDELSAETTRSYRVRAYYSGSPTEYTEWSEAVQATTDSEELTTIPRSFVITADIKLRDEAPEVSEPPGAFDGWFAVSRDNVPPDGILIYRRTGGELVFFDSYDVTNSGSTGRDCLRFSNSGAFLALCHGDSPGAEEAHFSIFDFQNGILTLSDQFTNGRRALACDWSPDDSRIIVGTRPFSTTPSDQNIALLSQVSGSLTQLDIAQITSTSNCRTVSYCPDGVRAAAQINDGSNTLHLLSLSGDSISVLDTIAVGGGDPQSSKCIAWRPDGRYLAQTTGGTLRVYDSDGDSLSLTDSITTTSSDIAWNKDGSVVYTEGEAFSFNGATLVKLGDTSASSGAGDKPIAVTSDANFLAARQSSTTFRMFNISSLPGTQTDEETVSATMRSFDFTDAK